VTPMLTYMTSTVERGALHARGCLFCLRSDGGFTSREHVVSEALGNHEYILPPGVVCDRCNSRVLALVDEALVNFPPITLLRGERGIPTKAGKAVASKWGNATLFWGPERGTLNVVGGRKAVRHMQTDGKTSRGQLTLRTGGPVTATRIRRMVRSIWKSTLEFIYLDHGADVAFDPHLDDLRAAVLDDKSHGWALLPRNATPTPNVQLTYEPRIVDGRWTLPTVMNVFGVVFVTDPMMRDFDPDDLEAPEPLNIWKF
jgi:hypothetical protein